MVDAQDLVTGIRWELLERIASGPCSSAELARDLGTSPANVSQHLKLLELGGLVRKERANGKSSYYSLSKTLALVTILDQPAYRGAVVIDPLRAVELRLILDNKPRARIVRKFLALHEELARGFLAFGAIKENKDEGEIQLLVIANDVKALRKEYANLDLKPGRIVIWSHTPGEFQEGLQRSEAYFKDMVHDVAPIFDPDGLLRHWKGGLAPGVKGKISKRALMDGAGEKDKAIGAPGGFA